MTSQPIKQSISIYIFPNISGSTGNQAMKFGHLIEYNMENNFLGKSCRKCGCETTPRPFSKISKLNVSLDQECKVSYSLFLLYNKLRSIAIYWNQVADHSLLPHIKLFKETKWICN